MASDGQRLREGEVRYEPLSAHPFESGTGYAAD